MMNEAHVAAYYAKDALEATILAALGDAGKDVTKLAPADLAPVDEFHTGGAKTTAALFAGMGLKPGMRVLDIGCGIGGAARQLVQQRCRVVGIDLTFAYAKTAAALTRRMALDKEVRFAVASANRLPFAAASFDAAIMLHVGMNIADKGGLFAEARRVLRRGGAFGIFDLMRTRSGTVEFPVPWAESAATSCLATAAQYRAELEAHRFALLSVRNRRSEAIATFARAGAAVRAPLGLHILMGANSAEKIAHVRDGIASGAIVPWTMICCAL